MPSKTVTTTEIRRRKHSGEKIVMCTAYDATFASILDKAGMDILLVGDSLGMVFQGHDNTIPVKLEHMLYHTAAVSRGAKRAQVVGDMPFMSYRISAEQALEAATRFLQEAGAHAVKLEGGEDIAPVVERIVAAGIPVMGHVGLTPQSVHAMGGFKVQGKDEESAHRILNDALSLQSAGAYCIVLEGIPTELAGQITKRLKVPTIGIGAGPQCDGQVLVCYDLLGMNPNFKPKFLKQYTNLHEQIVEAAHSFAQEVRDGQFPTQEHSFSSRKLRLVDDNSPESDDAKLYSTTA